MRYLFIALLLIMAGCSKETIEEPTKPTIEEPTKPTKPTKPTRDQIADFCSDASTIADSSPSKESIVRIARDVGIEGEEYQLHYFYMAVLNANVAVATAEFDNAFSNFAGSGSYGNDVPHWEKVCAKSVRKDIAIWD